MQLKVKGTQAHHIEVTVDAVDAARLVADTLLRMYGLIGLDSGRWIDKKGLLCEEEDYYHGTSSTKVIGKATEEQKLAYQVAHDLIKLFNNYTNNDD